VKAIQAQQIISDKRFLAVIIVKPHHHSLGFKRLKKALSPILMFDASMIMHLLLRKRG
jgi:hypothetical protein